MDPSEPAVPATPEGVGLTALLVAQARALESGRPDRLFDDSLATDFVVAAGPAYSAIAARIDDRLTFQRACVAIRTRFFDDCLLDAASAGCRQVVVLGAGLDARAFRLAWPSGLRLFELDQADVVDFKEQVLSSRAARPTCERRVVRADLREEWPAALVAAGFRANEPTAWLAEGLLMYLTEGERDRLLHGIGGLSAPGSRLALDHRGPAAAEPQAAPGRSSRGAGEAGGEHRQQDGESPVALLGIRMHVGETDRSLTDPTEWLADHGWRATVYPAAECFVRYGRPVPAALAASGVRLWLATAARA